MEKQSSRQRLRKVATGGKAPVQLSERSVMTSAGARAYNGSQGAVFQTRGRASGAMPPEDESFGGPLADIVRFTNILTYLLSILRASKGNGKVVNFSVILRHRNGRILVYRF